MKIAFTVYGEPVAQGRPRATHMNGMTRLYDPKKSRDANAQNGGSCFIA